METESKKRNRYIVAIKFKKIKYVRNVNRYRIFNNENCLGLTFEVHMCCKTFIFALVYL